MADMQDNFGRNVQSSGMAPEELKGMVSSLMKGDVATKKTFGAEKPSKDQEKILNALGQFKDFKNELAQIKKILEKAGSSSSRQTKPIKTTKKESISSEQSKYFKSMDDFTTHALKKGSIYVHDVYVEKQLKAIKEIGKIAARGGRRGGSPRPPGTPPTPTPPTPPGPTQTTPPPPPPPPAPDEETLSSIFRRNSSYNRFVIAQYAQIKKGFSDIISPLTDIIAKENEFRQGIKQTAYQTEGITSATKSLQDAYTDVDHATELTGKTRSEFLKEFNKNNKIGLKSADKAAKLTKTQLYAEEQLGLEAGSLNKTYKTMAVELRLGNNQIFAISKGMQNIQRSAGLTGEHMAEVVSSSEKFMRHMSNAGKVSSQAVTNMMRVSAEAAKLGVSGKQDEMNELMSNSANMFKDGGNANMRSAMFQAAGNLGIKNADIQNIPKDETKYGQFAAEYEKIWAANVGLSDLSKETVDNLNSAQTFQANLAAQAQGFEGIGELQKHIEGLKKGAKPFAESLKDINKEIEDSLSPEQKLLAIKKKESLVTQKSIDVINAAAEGRLEAAQKESYIKGAQEAGLSVSSNASDSEVMNVALTKSIQDLNKNRSEAGLSELPLDELAAAAASGSKKDIDKFLTAYNQGQMELDTTLKKNADPMTGIKHELEKISGALEKMTGGVLSWLVDWITFFGVFGGAIALVGVKLGLLGANTISGFLGIKRGISSLLGFFREDDPQRKERIKAERKFYLAGLKSGSIYVHDTHVEKALSGLEGGGGGGGGDGSYVDGDGKKKKKGKKGKGKGSLKTKPPITSKPSWGSRIKGGARSFGGRVAGWGSSIKSGVSNLSGRMIGGPQLGGGGGILSKGFNAIKGLGTGGAGGAGLLGKATGAIKGLGAGSKIGGMISGGLGGLASGGGMLGGVTGALGPVLGGLSKFAGPLALVAGGISAVTNGFGAMENAANMFGVAQEELTTQQKASAFAAGTLTGALDFVSFGIFSDYLGPEGSITSGLANFFDGIATGFTNAYESFTGAFSGSAEENDKRRAEEGYSYSGGIGATLGGIMDLDLEKTLDGIGETIVAPFAAVGGWLSSLNPFSTGTKEIKNSGAAFLHAGEAVIPADIAQGDGAFKTKDMMSMLGNPIQGMLNMLGGPIEGISKALGLGSPIQGMMSMLGLGDPEQSMESGKIQSSSVSSGSELSVISEASLMQVEVLKSVLGVLEEIKESLNDSGPIKSFSRPHSGIDTDIVPPKPTKYYHMNVGKYDQGSAAQVKN